MDHCCKEANGQRDSRKRQIESELKIQSRNQCFVYKAIVQEKLRSLLQRVSIIFQLRILKLISVENLLMCKLLIGCCSCQYANKLFFISLSRTEQSRQPSCCHNTIKVTHDDIANQIVVCYAKVTNTVHLQSISHPQQKCMSKRLYCFLSHLGCFLLIIIHLFRIQFIPFKFH